MGDSFKHQARAVRRAERRALRIAVRAARRKHWRCFWTWPLGHEYVDFGGEEDRDMRCVACDMPQAPMVAHGHVRVVR